MKLLGLHLLHPHLADSKRGRQVSAWVYEVRSAHWHRPVDVVAQYPTVKRTQAEHFRFGNIYPGLFLDLEVAFQHQIALVVQAIYSDQDYDA